MSLLLLSIGTLSVSFASNSSSEIKEATTLTSTYSFGTCTITFTVTNGNLSYSWTESYYAVNATHCAQIARDRLEELKAQEEVEPVLEPIDPEVPVPVEGN